jgi:hypothetical protein
LRGAQGSLGSHLLSLELAAVFDQFGTMDLELLLSLGQQVPLMLDLGTESANSSLQCSLASVQSLTCEIHEFILFLNSLFASSELSFAAIQLCSAL